MMATKPKTVSAGLAIWLLLIALALVLIPALLPINLQNIPGDWQITAAAPALPDAVPYSLLVNAILALRYLVLAVFLAISGLIVLQPEHASLWIVPLPPRERMDKEA
jgi:hypothetical protein